MIARFGPFLFDGDARQVTGAGGERLHLTRKAFDLLAILIEESPRVVGKPELHERLWADTFVSDAALAGLVKELRRVLRDPRTTERWIRTCHGVGYAFTRETEEKPGSPDRDVECWVLARDKRVPLREGEHLIGRDPSAAIRLDAAGVSRRHARIVVGHGRVLLEDLGSKNGTAVRGSVVRDPVVLQDGDSIDIGPISLLYRSSGPGMSTETIVR